MPRKIRTRNKMNKRNKKRSLKKMKGGGDGEYYFIYSNNPTFSRYNGLLVVGAGQKYNFHSGGQQVTDLTDRDITNYKKCCLKCINNFSDQNEIMRHLGSYCHTCYGDVPIS